MTVTRYIPLRYLQVPDLLMTLGNGSLVFLPFSSRRYDPLVHDARFVCLAHTQGGVYASTPSKVTAGKIFY